jgi:dihydrofolate reductase
MGQGAYAGVTVTLVLARARNGVIGRDGALPWHIPADLRRFKALTMGKPMIMGRKTFEGFPAPLPGRRHIVLTRDRGWRTDAAEVAHDVEEALALADGDASVIGGAEIFHLFEPLADRVEMTVIWRDYEGDARFSVDQGWDVELFREFHAADGDRPAFTFFTLIQSESSPRP